MSELTTNPLGKVFFFSAHDLKANREHRLSGAQLRRLWGQALLHWLGWLLLSWVPVLFTWALLSSVGENWNDSRALIAYVIGALLALFYGLANYRALLLIFDLLLGRVGAIKGKAKIWGRYLIFGKYRFVVEESALEYIQVGLSYRVFILPLSRTPLSIEFAE